MKIPLLLAFALLALPARAHDHLNLEEGIPVEAEDAYVTPYGGWELQGVFKYERTEEGTDRLRLRPRLEWGVWRNWQATVSAPFFTGGAEREGSGQVETEALYNLNSEGVYVPALTFGGAIQFPTGLENHGYDPFAKAILTKTLSRGTLLQRLHLNALYFHNGERREGERLDRFKAAGAYEVRVSPNDILLVGGFHEEDIRQGRISRMAEAGLRHQFDPLTVLSVGGAAGLGREAPDYRFTVGFQRSLTFPAAR